MALNRKERREGDRRGRGDAEFARVSRSAFKRTQQRGEDARRENTKRSRKERERASESERKVGVCCNDSFLNPNPNPLTLKQTRNGRFFC
jgi:hypothetical protein